MRSRFSPSHPTAKPSTVVGAVVCLLLLLAPRLALAQPSLLSAGNASARGGSAGSVPSQGWIVIPDGAGAVLAHVPPRRGIGWVDGSIHASADGTLRKAMHLDSMPVAIGAVGSRLYLVFEQSTLAGEPVRRPVSSVVAHPSAVGDFWFFEPEGRLYSHPSLPADGVLRSLAGTPLGLAALIGPGSTSRAAQARLLLLRKGKWTELASPVPAASVRTVLVGLGTGVGVLTIEPQGHATMWGGSIPAKPARTESDRRPTPSADPYLDDEDRTVLTEEDPVSEAPFALEWRKTELAADGALAGLELARTRFFECGGLLTFVSGRPDGAVSVGTLTEHSAYELAQVPGVGTRFAAVPLDSSGRVALVWMAEDSPGLPVTASADHTSKTHPEVREVSAFTGRILYSGPGQGDAPVTARELQLLIGALVGLMTVVLLLVLRGEPDDGAFHLPDGTALAEPGRRFTASVVDLSLALLIAARLWDVPVSEILSPSALLSGESLWVIGAALGIGLAGGTLSEWLTGKSPGKFLTGCEVVDVRTSEVMLRRPRLWQSLVRNSIKWFVPPVAMLGLLESAGRHRGDSFARCAVVIQVDATGPEPGPPEE